AAFHRGRRQRLALDDRADEPRLVEQPAVGVRARRELLDHADGSLGAEVGDDRLIREQVLEWLLHAIRDVGEALLFTDHLLLDPLFERASLESPLPIDLE